MSDGKTHARCSPSGAAGWLNCSGWDSSSRSSSYADWGTQAHSLAEACLRSKGDPYTFIGADVLPTGSKVFVPITEEMADCVKYYLDFVGRLPGQAFIEQAVPLSSLTGEDGATGTVDHLSLDGDVVTITDLKGGMGERVDAEENEQLSIYALAAVELFSSLDDIRVVELNIVQPRLDHISSWRTTVDELRAKYTRRLYVMAQRRLAGDSDSNLNPGKKTCRWCMKKAKCSAYRAFVETATELNFEDLSEGVSEIKARLSAEPQDNLALAMNAVDMVEVWCKAVRAEVERLLLSGKPVGKYKLVEGRKGGRKWSDETLLSDIAAANKDLLDILYPREIISPAQAEKKLARTKPEVWAKIKDSTVQTRGKPSVAPENDKRPPFVVTSSEDMFQDLSEGDEGEG